MHPEVAAVLERVVADRRALHRIPEPAREERLTAAYVAAALHELGLEPRTGVGGHGIVCDLPPTDSPDQNPGSQSAAQADPSGDVVASNGTPFSGRPFVRPSTVALRADLDGIRVEERTGLSFASVHPGLMHACGHDGHMAMLLGAARVFAANPPKHLRLRLLFQPAEEQFGGAQDLIRDGALEGVDRVFGAHLWSWFPTGTVAACPGPMMAQTERFTIDVTGRGGHAALPRDTGDALVTAALLVTALQTAVSRGVNLPAEPAVCTVGELHAGTAPNVIAATAQLRGTLRALTPEVMEALRGHVRRIAVGVAAANGAEARVTFTGGYPALVNHAAEHALVASAAAGVADFVTAVPVMAGEDFSYYLRQVPGCFFFVGAGDPAVPVERRAHHHEPGFSFDENALAVGVGLWHALVRSLDG